MGWLRQSQFSCNTCNTSGDRTSAIVGKCPDWNGLSVKLGGLLLFPEPEPEPEPELQPDEPEDVVAILLPLSLALLLRPPSIDWFKLPIRGFLKGLEGLVSVKKICMFRNVNHDYSCNKITTTWIQISIYLEVLELILTLWLVWGCCWRGWTRKSSQMRWGYVWSGWLPADVKDVASMVAAAIIRGRGCGGQELYCRK